MGVGDSFVQDLVKQRRQARGDSSVLKVITGLPQSPADPGWAKRIPPPEPDGTLTGALAAAQTPPSRLGNSGTIRPIISFGPSNGSLVLSVEDTGTGEIVASAVLSRKSIVAILPVLRAFGPIRDLTGGALHHGHAEDSGSAPRRDSRGPADEFDAAADWSSGGSAGGDVSTPAQSRRRGRRQENSA